MGSVNHVTDEPVVKKRALWFGPSSGVPVYLGVVAIAVGFALLGVAWADVAGLTIVAMQTPYLVSAGFTGLGLAVVGVVVLVTGVRRQDGARRDRQYETLTETFRNITADIERQLQEGD